MKYAVSCDNETETKIQKEVDFLLCLSASEKCEQPSWCNHDDMPEETEEKPEISEALGMF